MNTDHEYEEAQSKPPLGLRPRIIADRYRAIEIHEAIGRSLAAGSIQRIPVEWAEELLEIIARYQPND